MQVSLWSHPANPSIAPLDIEAGCERLSATVLRFRYLVRGPVGELVIPPPSSPIRADNLWRTSCFEAFLSPPEGPAYVELNFSPSSRWAAYDFADYRQDMVPAALPGPPDIEVVRQPNRLEMIATVSLDAAASLSRLRLCAVIEERGGNLSYWADSHPSNLPDFHRQDCIELQLPPAPRP
jgi:hypothetical protein